MPPRAVAGSKKRPMRGVAMMIVGARERIV
jgi:hypothetical protein